MNETLMEEYAKVEAMVEGLDRQCTHELRTYKPELRRNEFYADLLNPLQCDTCNHVWECEHESYEHDSSQFRVCLDCGELSETGLDYDEIVKYGGYNV